MSVLPAKQFPGAEHDPLAYPGLRPEFSYVYYQDAVYEITARGNSYADLWVSTHDGQVTLDEFLQERGNAPAAQRHPVLAVGSNGCPGRLAEKYEDQPEVALPVLLGTMTDTAVVYSRRLVTYGALPSTYLHQTRAISRLPVTMLTDEQLVYMDKTERVGQFYLRISIPGYFSVDAGPKIEQPAAYLDRKILAYEGMPVLLEQFTHHGPDWPIMDERKALSLIFDCAGLLLGEPIETRHQQLLADDTLKLKLSEFLETRMGALSVDIKGRLLKL